MGKHNKRKILFTIPTLQAGGAERVLVNLLNYFALRQDLKLFLLVHDQKNQKPFYPVSPDITVFHAGHWGGFRRLFLIFSTYFYIKKVRPDITIGFILWNNIITVLASKIAGVPCIVAERNTLHVVRNFFVKWIRDFSYTFADSIVVQTKRAKEMVLKRLRHKTSVIYNPLIVPEKKLQYESKRIVAVGRLHQQKGFDCLIKAFARLHKNYPDWFLTIWGEGPERSSLEHLIQQEGLGKSIFLPGATQQLFDEMAKASIFVLSSRFEGMPNALCEAMGLGLSVVATDCLTGPRELIDNGKDGFLVPVDDSDAMAKAIETLITDEPLRKAFGEKAATKMKCYDIKTIAALWEKEWERVLGKKEKCVD